MLFLVECLSCFLTRSSISCCSRGLQGQVPASNIAHMTHKAQSTLGTFGLRKNVRSEMGRWLREPSPEFVAFGPQCKECGARFKTPQGLGNHRRCIHGHIEVDEQKVPHWAWHFLKGAEPIAVDDGAEPIAADDGHVPPSHHSDRMKFRRRKLSYGESRRGRDKRQRYTAQQKLEVVENWMFAKENKFDVDDYLGAVSEVNAFKWSKQTDALEDPCQIHLWLLSLCTCVVELESCLRSG